jgi:cobalt/nickel transport system permease protein
MSCYEADRLDRIAYGDSPLHRLDPRAKILATLAFILAVVSQPKYELFGLAPFILFPLLTIVIGEIPGRLIFRRVLLVSPFALLIGAFNPFLDRQVFHHLWGFDISGGWISFSSILVRFALTVSAALALIATTSFPSLCQGLTAMRVPRTFVVQLLFLYRYLFLLAEEGSRILRARELRARGWRGRTPRVAVSIVGTLFLRTLDRAERIYQAMSARGYDGNIRQLRRLSFTVTDGVFLAAVAVGCAFFRLLPVTYWMGRWGLDW